MKLLITFSNLIIILFCVSCQNKEHQKTEENLFVVTNPLKKDTIINQEYVCQIKSIQHIEIMTLERGYVQAVLVDEGQFVKKGELLFQIMPLIYQAETRKTQAEVSFAEIEYLNTKNLADSNIVSQTELALAKAKLDKAKAELSLAQVHLNFTEIRAPFDGIIGRFNDVRLGSLVEEGELLTTLSDNSKMWVYFNVPESEYLNYIYNATLNTLPKVSLQMANKKIFENPGIIETIEADFNNENGNIAFRATFENPNGILRHGETGNILMPINLKNAILVPQKATFEILDKKYVFVVSKDNIAESKQITISHEMPHLYAVIDGINENDKILIEGLRKVKNKQKINFDFIPIHKIASELTQLHAE